MVENAKTPEPNAQPVGSGQKSPEDSKGQSQDLEGIIIGLRKQLAKAKEQMKALESEVSASRGNSEGEGGHPSWTEDDQAKKEFAKLQKEIKTLKDAKALSDRKAKILELSSQTGIPLEVLSDAGDDFDLARKIAEFKVDSQKPEGKPEPPKIPYETGHVAPGAEKGVWQMSNREFAESYGRKQAEARIGK